MATYYCDPENHTGTASDSVGGGTTAGNAYVTLSYAVGDVNVTHGKNPTTTISTDNWKMIGTYAPDDTEINSLNSNVLTYGSGFTLLSDGATAFGTQSPTSRATVSHANGTIALMTTTVHYATIDGFTLTGFNHGVYVFWGGTSFIVQNCHCDTSALGTSPYVASGRHNWRFHNNYVKARTTGAAGRVVGTYTAHTVSNNFFDLATAHEVMGSALCATGSNSQNTFVGNVVLLGGAANAVGLNSNMAFVGNTIVGGSNKKSIGVYLQNYGGKSLVSNNHFENLNQAVGSAGTATSSPYTTSPNVKITDNTYFNVDYIDTPNPAYTQNWLADSATVRGNVNLGSSGVVNAATGDLRTARNRIGKCALAEMNLSELWIDSLTTGASIQSPTQYRPFG